MSMQKRKEIPSKPRFALAAKRAYELLSELDICEFPVDPRKIIDYFPSWHLKGWLELCVNTDEEDPLNIAKEQAEAKTVMLRGSDEYLIVYDDRVDNIQRIRWTLAHEIGHIVMGHLVQFEATALNRRGLTREDYGVLEVEAHCFASDLLAPKTIIRRFDFQNDPQGIALVCDISKDAAERRLKELKRMDFGYYSTENRILRNFYKHLSNGGFYQVVHDTACRFYPSVIYENLCKYSRICRQCNSFVTDEKFKYCTVCGSKVPLPHSYLPLKKTSSGVFSIGWSFYLEGNQYYEIPMGKKGRVDFCPICRDAEYVKDRDACNICGTPTVNRCTVEGTDLSRAYRYCPECGAETAFKTIYDKLPERLNAERVLIPNRFEDYIEYSYWQFIVMTICYWEKALHLYAALEDSIAFYDCEDMVIFVRSGIDVDCIQKSKEVILTCLTKYGESSVKNISVLVAEMAA